MDTDIMNMPREKARDLARHRRYCQIVGRKGEDYGYASEDFLHDFRGNGIRYHRSVRLLIWAPNSRDMLFRWADDGWDSAVGGHVFYKELATEALQRLINEQIRIDEPKMSLKDVLVRTNSLFRVKPCIATGMELVEVYSMTMRHAEVLESIEPILSIYPRDLEIRISENDIKTTQTLDQVLRKLNDKYIF